MRLIKKIFTGSKQKGVKTPGPALTWHQVHGANIELSEDMSVARRQSSYCQSIVFSGRPLAIGEKVWLRLLTVSEQVWRGGLRFGVSGVDPAHWSASSKLPKYLCPDMTSSYRVWARAMSDKYVQQGAVVFFSVKSTGDLVWGVDGREKGVLVSGVDISKPLWAVVDVYGSTAVSRSWTPEHPSTISWLTLISRRKRPVSRR